MVYDLFYILISADNQYSTYRYQTSTEEYTPNDLLFDLQTVELAQLAVFNYSITKESDDDMTLDYIFRFIEQGTQLVEYEDGVGNNESVTYAVRTAIEAGVLELVYQGDERGFWTINKEKENE